MSVLMLACSRYASFVYKRAYLNKLRPWHLHEAHASKCSQETANNNLAKVMRRELIIVIMTHLRTALPAGANVVGTYWHTLENTVQRQKLMLFFVLESPKTTNIFHAGGRECQRKPWVQ